MKRVRYFILLMQILLLPVISYAENIKLHVAEFAISGPANNDDIRGVLQSLLTSRLSGDGIATIDGKSGADLQLVGSYITFGAAFSIDASIKNSAGETVGRSFVQGQVTDEMIPAVGKLANQLRQIIKGVKIPSEPTTGMKSLPPTTPAPASLEKPVDPAQPAGDIVRTAPAAQPVTKQSRIEGQLLGIAPVRTMTGGDREFVVIDAQKIYLYRLSSGIVRSSEYSIKGEGQILSVDTADLDKDGKIEAYVTVMDREELQSIVLSVDDKGFTIIADSLPFYFRSLGVPGKEQLFGQQMGRDRDDFYGNVSRVIKKGNSFTLGEPLKLPSYANIYTFNRFISEGKTRTVVLDTDGNIRILDEAGEELWKGSDRFGGSEVSFERDEQQMQPLSLNRYRRRFIEQRIVITTNNEIIVPRNSGLLVLGNSRSYSRNSVFGFAWNGATLEERWHTKESASYLADYHYDDQRKELIILEQVQKSGIFSKGASTISVKKIE